jgi:hypothetical protein
LVVNGYLEGKYRTGGTIQTFKARLVAKGFRQREGIDYFNTHAPVVRITSIRVLVALESIYKLVVHQMDLKITFLNGNLDDEVYMDQPKCGGFPYNIWNVKTQKCGVSRSKCVVVFKGVFELGKRLS